ncbi:hypothetical protein AB4254_11025 [Vibrio breoganii]
MTEKKHGRTYYVPVFVVSAIRGVCTHTNIRITRRDGFDVAYARAVDFYCMTRSAPQSVREKLLSNPPEKELYYFRYIDFWNKGAEISIVDLYERLGISGFDMQRVRALDVNGEYFARDNSVLPC